MFYNVVERNSFNELNIYTKMWNEKQKEHFESGIVIVANMCDRLDRVISKEEGFKAAKKYNAVYV